MNKKSFLNVDILLQSPELNNPLFKTVLLSCVSDNAQYIEVTPENLDKLTSRYVEALIKSIKEKFEGKRTIPSQYISAIEHSKATNIRIGLIKNLFLDFHAKYGNLYNFELIFLEEDILFPRKQSAVFTSWLWENYPNITPNFIVTDEGVPEAISSLQYHLTGSAQNTKLISLNDLATASGFCNLLENKPELGSDWLVKLLYTVVYFNHEFTNLPKLVDLDTPIFNKEMSLKLVEKFPLLHETLSRYWETVEPTNENRDAILYEINLMVKDLFDLTQLLKGKE